MNSKSLYDKIKWPVFLAGTILAGYILLDNASKRDESTKGLEKTAMLMNAYRKDSNRVMIDRIRGEDYFNKLNEFGKEGYNVDSVAKLIRNYNQIPTRKDGSLIILDYDALNVPKLIDYSKLIIQRK